MTLAGMTKVCKNILTLLSGSICFKYLHNDIGHHTYLVFVFFICLQHIHFIEKWVTGMTDYLSDSISILVNCFIFTSKQDVLI